ncbi:MAG: aldose 1-epimerase family protein [Muribaculaceae bacterium]|nr:aldose 1-epimerase family protein [Muribaculaceae bacterium]
MSKVEIKHGAMSAEISTLGAELTSLKRDGIEYLWQGNPEFWAGQSPLLFPTTGRCWDNRYRHDGKEYHLDIHGFARIKEFTVVDSKEDRVTMAFHSDDSTLEVYPFPFFLFVTYKVDGKQLTVEWMVRNQGDKDMYFQIGAHPAFNLPDFDPADDVRGYFKFETDGVIDYLIPLEKGCVKPDERHRLELDSEGMMPITSKTFDIDTYVIDSEKITACSLLTPERLPWLTVHFHMPILSLWAPTIKHPDCPFVCIEPWCGSCDTVGYEGDFGDRRIMNRLEPAQHFITSYTIELNG